MALRIPLLFFLIAFCLSGLPTKVTPAGETGGPGTLRPFGLQGQWVTALASEYHDPNLYNAIPSPLFAGTIDSGVFQISLTDPSLHWQALGLAGKPITALGVQRWGIGPMTGLKLFAGVTPNHAAGDSTLIFSREVMFGPDTVWAAADSGIDKTRLRHVSAFNSYYFTGHRPPQPVLLGGESGLYWATFQDKWNEAKIDEYVKINAIDVSPHWFGTLAWATGSHGLSPAAFRSTDQGKSWTTFLLPSLIEGEGLAVAINPWNPETVFIGQIGGVWITTTSGWIWESSGMPDSPVTITALAFDPVVDGNVFAGGSGLNGAFAFYYSEDAGASWTRVEPDAGDTLAAVTSLAVIDTGFAERRTLVFIGTAGTGVWLYEPAVNTAVEDPGTVPVQFTLHQNFPNPFNPRTVIQYDLSRAGHVQLMIYNLLGQRVRTLVDTWQAAGRHRVSWNGTKGAHGEERVPSGVYYYRLEQGERVITKKMILMQ